MSTPHSRDHLRRHPILLRAMAIAILSVSAVILGGILMPPATATPAPGDTIGIRADPADLRTPAGRVVLDLTNGHFDRVPRELPADFASTMGYQPIMDHGHPANPTGDCSSPIPLPQRFTASCRTHDFGYDVLRYAQHTGHPLGGWARLRLDRMLVNAMSESCDTPWCSAAASLADVGLRVNTWRQFDGPPVPESDAAMVTSGITRGIDELAELRFGTRR